MDDGRRLSEDSRKIAQTSYLRLYAPPPPPPKKKRLPVLTDIWVKIVYLFIIYIGKPVSRNR